MKKIENKLRKWQKIFRLSDWNIVLMNLKNKKKAGDFKIDRDTKSAIIKLNFSNRKENLERTLIHELLHLKLIDLDEIIEKTLYELFPKGEKEKGFNIIYNEFLKNLEIIIDDLTKGFSDLSGIRIKDGEIKSLVERRLK